jgi:NAD(P)-dependent dehydrogenase (short-subunit alcohol dehydrogenase family)
MSDDRGRPVRVVITGSTRGLGLCMAREFLSRGCAVLVSGRTDAAVQAALGLLRTDFPRARLHGFPCDVTDSPQVEALWKEAVDRFGGVDHWILNAGIGQPTLPIWEIPPALMESIVATDLLGPLYGARAAMRGMRERRSGAIWFMEGHGSDGRIMKGLSVYGTAKRSVRYAAAALAFEARGTGVLVGALSPGIMITDFTMKQVDRADRAAWDRTKKVFNILADRPETVAAFLVPRILAARASGTRIAWLTAAKILWRFATAGITGRKVISE